jgi:hypothetical protein
VTPDVGDVSTSGATVIGTRNVDTGEPAASTRGSAASLGGGGVRTNQYAPPHTISTATADAISRLNPNQPIHAFVRSDRLRTGSGRKTSSTIDLLDRREPRRSAILYIWKESVPNRITPADHFVAHLIFSTAV